ncbi:murein biosynthesis integral membrane protein MurJ [Georgenia sp. SYP-B2076]|uniref:murein biosynthesis integral membrane protein MurJ n=1 Tax=Georgenia sp. SYP-B2076 TaxID=2495881 RepID=UPI0013E0E052|nr:murein biosynthesis integral membrane protein MurJ [Georgenia sp. SYP-B2076]
MSEPRPRGVAGSSAVMFAGTLVSRLLGVVRSPLLLGAAIGINTGAANAFAVANKLPNIIYMLIAGGVLNAVLVPQIVRAIRQHDDGGQAYVNRLLTLAILGLGALTALLTVGAGVLVSLFAGTLPPQWYDLAVTFGYWCIPQVFFYGMYTVLGQILNARGNFGPYMWAPALNNVVAIAGLGLYLALFGGVSVIDPTDSGLWSANRVAVLAGAATLGVTAQALVLILPLRRAGFRYRPDLRLRGSGLGRAGKVATWVFAAVAAGQISTVMISRAAARASALGGDALGVAGNAAYDTAYLIYSLPTSLVVVSIVTALFTRMAGNAAGKDVVAVRADLSVGLRTVGVFSVFAAGALMVLALPVVRVITGTVTYAEAQSIARVVVAMLVGLVGVGAFTVVQRVYYAFEDARQLFWLQVPMIAIVTVGAALSQLLPPEWTVVGIGASMSVSNILGAALTYLGLRRHLPSLDGGRVLRTHVRVGLAAGPAALVGWGLLHLLGTSGAELSVLGALWRIAVVGLVMAALYVVLLRRLHVDELGTIARPAGRMVAAVGRRASGPLGRLLVRLGTAAGGAPTAGRAGGDHGGPDDDGPGPGTGPGGPDDGPSGRGPLGGGPGTGGPGPDDGPDDGRGPGDNASTDVPAPEHAARAEATGGAGGATPPPPGSMVDASRAPLRTLAEEGRSEAPGPGRGIGVLDVGKGNAAGGLPRVLGGRYELLRSLWATGTGAARWSARDGILEREVQVLVLPPAGPHNAEVLDAARRASLVEDHRLLRVLDVEEDGARSFIVTDPVQGPDLTALAADGDVPIEQARAIIGEVASALESARRHGVRHLALRPPNVHLTPDGQVLVTGLGVDAALRGNLDPDESPLEATRRDAVDLVRLLYLAMTGLWPSPAEDGGAPAPSELRADVPADLDDLCVRTLVEDAGPRSTGELIRELAPWVDVEAPRPPQPAPAATATAATAAPAPATGVSAAPATAAPATAAEAALAADVTPTAVPSGATHAAGAFVAGSAIAPSPAGDAPAPPADATAPADAQAPADAPAPPADAPAPSGSAAAPLVLTPEEPGLSDLLAPPPPTAHEDAPPPPPPEAGQDEAGPQGDAGAPVAHTSDAGGGIVTAPPPPSAAPAPRGWAPRRRRTQAEPPEFTEILHAAADAPDTTPARHTPTTGAIAGLGVLAADAARNAASTVASGSRRAAESTKTAAGSAREGLGSALTAGKQRLEQVEARRQARTQEHDDLLPHQPYEDEVDGPEVPFKERRIDPTRIVLVGLAVLVLVLLLISLRILFAPPEPVSLPTPAPSVAASPEASPEPTTPTPAPVAPVVASLTALDPQGDDGENPELTPRALDGDPATIWRSRSYANPQYGMKDGIGLAVRLAAPALVSRVELDVQGAGGTVQVRATSPDTPTEGAVLAEGPMGPGAVLTFEPVETDSLVLWFPALPEADSDGKNRIELAELRVG